MPENQTNPITPEIKNQSSAEPPMNAIDPEKANLLSTLNEPLASPDGLENQAIMATRFCLNTRSINESCSPESDAGEDTKQP